MEKPWSLTRAYLNSHEGAVWCVAWVSVITQWQILYAPIRLTMAMASHLGAPEIWHHTCLLLVRRQGLDLARATPERDFPRRWQHMD